MKRRVPRGTWRLGHTAGWSSCGRASRGTITSRNAGLATAHLDGGCDGRDAGTVASRSESPAEFVLALILLALLVLAVFVYVS